MFNLFPRRSPSLPQNDNLSQQAKRQNQLYQSQALYQWDLENPNVGPVPMASSVPSDDKPTLAWTIEVIQAILPVVDNLLANAKDATELVSLKEGVEEIKSSINETAPGLHWSMISSASSMLKALVELYLELVQQEVKEYRAEEGLEAYKNLFLKLPLPDIAGEFQHNACFARYRVAGQNPMLIKSIAQIPDKLGLTDDGFKLVMGDNDSLANALTQQRVFIVDYHELSILSSEPQHDTKKVLAPIALFALDNTNKQLTPVAIQTGQDKTEDRLIYAAKDSNDAHYWQWQAAMTIVQVADGNYHELFVHLGRTHLLIEAFAIATHRCLAESHPLNVLLLPHFEGSLFINNSAAGSLIAKGGPIESIFGAKITATQKAAGTDRLALDFYDYMLPKDLALRGVDSAEVLPDYPYRDDALLVWDAIHSWTTAYINVYYSDDSQVSHDYELVAWTEALMMQGAVKGFKAITSKAQLADVLTMVIFTASAQHAAVNFPQKELMSFAPAVTGAIWSKESAASTTEKEWLASLPPMSQSLQQLSVLTLLGGVYYRQLGEYKTNNFPYFDWFEDPNITQGGGPLSQFQQHLETIEKTITKRNLTRPAYTYLLPSKIPPSINI